VDGNSAVAEDGKWGKSTSCRKASVRNWYVGSHCKMGRSAELSPKPRVIKSPKRIEKIIGIYVNKNPHNALFKEKGTPGLRQGNEE